MLVKQIYIHRGYDKKLTGSIEFINARGEIKLNLSDEAARNIVAACADALVQSSKETADLMKADVFEAITMLNPPSVDEE